MGRKIAVSRRRGGQWMGCEGELVEASNSCIQDMGSSPFGIASEKGHVQSVKTLLELGTHINHQNKVKII